MARFAFLDDSAWNSYSDLAGGVIQSKSDIAFTYISASGLKIILAGTGFTYGADGLPLAGRVTALRVFDDSAQLAVYTGLKLALTDFVTLALGQTSGSAVISPADMDALYGLMREGNDLVYASGYGRTLSGYDGNDALFGGRGDDWFIGGAGIDRYFGGGGENGISFLDDPDVLHGVTIDFRLTLGNVLDDGHGNVETATDVTRAEGTNFADTFFGSGTFFGHGGNDTMTGGVFPATMDGGAGLDVYLGVRGGTLAFFDVTVSDQSVVINLAITTGPQILNDGFGNAEVANGFFNAIGSIRDDSLSGSARPNRLWGEDGRDVLIGFAGNDSLFGGDGNDTLDGGNGDDLLQEGAGNGRLIGGDGDDSLLGGAGKDYLVGGFGNNVLGFWDIGPGGHGATVNLNRVRGNILDDGYGNTETALDFENVDGSDRNDNFIGNAAANLLWGERGNDRLAGAGGADGLFGGYDNDQLFGGLGNDTVMGGFGVDTLTGGDGADYFLFDASPSGALVDRAADFQSGADKIVINSAGSSIGNATLLPAGFLAGAGVSAPRTASQIVIYDTSSGKLYLDRDGNGPENGRLVAIFDGHPKLTYDMISFEAF